MDSRFRQSTVGLDSLEHVFDYGVVAVTTLPAGPDPRSATIAALRARMERVQGGPRVPVAMAADLAGLVQLRTGGSCRVDQASLALTLLAEPSRAGSWVAVIGVADLGVEAAAQHGLNLDRTIWIPDPGADWAKVTATMVDVVPLIWLAPPGEVRPQIAAKLRARLRKRSATLVVQGPWPGADSELRITDQHWDGVESGWGRLRSRTAEVECRRPSAPVRQARIRLPPDPDAAPPSQELLPKGRLGSIQSGSLATNPSVAETVAQERVG